MGCKHEGGSDPRVKAVNRSCLVSRRQREPYIREKNVCGHGKHRGWCSRCDARLASATTARSKENYRKTIVPGMTIGAVPKERIAGVVCAISEHFVLADLLSRGYQVTKPFSHSSKHDLHVELPSVGWKGVQVKGGQLKKTTQALYAPKGRPVRSPILAVVHFPTHRIDYRAGTEPLPVELITELEKSIRGFESWQQQPNN